ncbi:MAG: hypothetical protein QF464_17800 [Myxococcota bacterium]|nr:hypothetical protein [Myxococcota bacterium]
MVRIIPAPLERVGALLERRISEAPSWTLGPVERELGQVEGQVHAGFGRAATVMRFGLATESDASTRVTAQVTARSRWTSLASCRRRLEAMLDDVVQAL